MHDHERRFGGGIERLRSPERIARLEVNRVVDLCLEGVEAHNLLDVGTGSGLFAEEFARQGLEIAGVDANPEMVAVAKSFLPQGDFRQAEAEKLPQADQSCDLVFMGVVLHETDDGEKALSEACRVARKRVAVLEWPYQQEESGPPLEHRLSPEKVQEMARKGCFSSVRVEPLNHTVLYLLDK